MKYFLVSFKSHKKGWTNDYRNLYKTEDDAKRAVEQYSYRKSKGRNDWEDCSDGEGTFFCLQKDKDTFVSARIEEVSLL